MNKKISFGTMAIAALAAFSISSCDKSKAQVDEKPAAEQPAATQTKIAYVEVDSIVSQYKFCKDYSLILQKKGQNNQNALVQKQQQLEAAVANFQQKRQQNVYTPEQDLAIQNQLQRQNVDLQALEKRLKEMFLQEVDSYNKALRDSIQHFLAVYNKDKKYTLILSKAGGDNILYADKAHDITNEVVAGLNKAYKPAAATEKAKDSKKK